jgi:hypothetical protein
VRKSRLRFACLSSLSVLLADRVAWSGVLGITGMLLCVCCPLSSRVDCSKRLPSVRCTWRDDDKAAAMRAVQSGMIMARSLNRVSCGTEGKV